jgi:small-conductance mechanosensitive channel
VNLAILAALNERGIEIPFPQRVVHAAARPSA